MASDPKLLRARFESDTLPLLGRVSRFAELLTGNQADADDLVQDTYVRAQERFHQFRQGSNLVAWLNRIAYTQFVNRFHRRTLGRMVPLIGDADAGPEPPHRADPCSIDAFGRASLSPSARETMDQSITQALDRLAPELRTILILYAVGEFSYREMADALAIPVGTVMSRLSRARAAMREVLLLSLPPELKHVAGTANGGDR